MYIYIWNLQVGDKIYPEGKGGGGIDGSIDIHYESSFYSISYLLNLLFKLYELKTMNFLHFFKKMMRIIYFLMPLAGIYTIPSKWT